MRRFVFLLLLVLVFTIPWQGLIVIPAFGTLSRVIGFLVGPLGVAAVIFSWRIRRLIAIHYLMGLFALWVFLSLIWSKNPEITAHKTITYCQLVGMAWLLWEFAPSPFRQRLVMHAYILGGFVALVGQRIWASRAGSVGRGDPIRLGGGGLDPNYFAITLLISIAFAAFHAFNKEAKSKLLRLACGCYCPIAAIGVLITGSRMGFVVLLFVVLLVVLGHLRTRPAYAFVLIATAAVFVVKAPDWIPATTLERVLSIEKELGSKKGTWGRRLEIWGAGTRVAKRHVLVGTGSGTFASTVGPEFSFRLSDNPYALDVDPAAHNSYLNTCVELGSVGLLLLFAMLALAAVYAFRMPKRERALWIVVLGTWCLAAITTNMEDRKLLWLMLGLLSSQYAALRAQESLAYVRRTLNIRRFRRALAMRRGWATTTVKTPVHD